MPSGLVLTKKAIQLITNAEHTGTEKVTLATVGFGSGKYKPTEDAKKLQNEFKKIAIHGGGAVGDGVIHLTVLDESKEEYSIFEIGVYTTGGDLFAIYSQNTPILEKSAQSNATLSVDLFFKTGTPDVVTVEGNGWVNPPATTEVQGVVELATNAETISGTDTHRAVTPASLQAKTSTYDRKGIVQLATDQEVRDGKSNEKAVTPSSLKNAIRSEDRETGFTRLADGRIFQWGNAKVAQDGSMIVFPFAFPSSVSSCEFQVKGEDPVVVSVSSQENGKVKVTHNGNGRVSVEWFAIGF